MDLTSVILLVDDDPDFRNLVSEFLAGHGYTVHAVGSAAGLRQVIEEIQPDLIILDVMMPGEDGLSVARRISGRVHP